MDSNGVIFKVNEVATNKLNTGESQQVAGTDIYIGVKTFVNPTRDVDPQYVEFSLGTGKIELVSGSDIKINSNSISDFKVYFTNSAEQLQKMVLQWDADDDLFVTEDSEISM